MAGGEIYRLIIKGRNSEYLLGHGAEIDGDRRGITVLKLALRPTQIDS